MVGHTDTVRCLQMNQEKQIVISGSYDETLKIWYILHLYFFQFNLETFKHYAVFILRQYVDS